MSRDKKWRANYTGAEKQRIDMCKDEEFKYPADFLDVDEPEPTPELPPFKASSTLYAASGVSMFSGVIVTLLEMMSRAPKNNPDTFIELLEWNPYSQLGLIGILLALFLFWLGLMTDRRGA
jgi:hypothetical protein